MFYAVKIPKNDITSPPDLFLYNKVKDAKKYFHLYPQFVEFNFDDLYGNDEELEELDDLLDEILPGTMISKKNCNTFERLNTKYICMNDSGCDSALFSSHRGRLRSDFPIMSEVTMYIGDENEVLRNRSLAEAEVTIRRGLDRQKYGRGCEVPHGDGDSCAAEAARKDASPGHEGKVSVPGPEGNRGADGHVSGPAAEGPADKEGDAGVVCESAASGRPGENISAEYFGEPSSVQAEMHTPFSEKEVSELSEILPENFSAMVCSNCANACKKNVAPKVCGMPRIFISLLQSSSRPVSCRLFPVLSEERRRLRRSRSDPPRGPQRNREAHHLSCATLRPGDQDRGCKGTEQGGNAEVRGR